MVTYRDAREINLKVKKDKDYLNSRIKSWIDQSELLMSEENIIDIWNTNILYKEGYQTPIGTTNNVLKSALDMLKSRGFLDTSQFKTAPDKKNYIWVKDNKIDKAINDVNAYFTNVRHVATVKPDEFPANNKIEYGVRQMLLNLSERKQLWEQIWIPCIEDMGTYGLSWFDSVFDRRINGPTGDFKFDTYHPRDVLVDIFARKMYFRDARYVIRKKVMTLDEAKIFFSRKEFGLTKAEIDNLKPDTEYRRFAGSREYSQLSKLQYSSERFVTVYIGEYKQYHSRQMKLTDYYGLNDYENEIPKEDNIFEIDEISIYDFIYNTHLGCVLHKEADYYDKTDFDNWQYAVAPFYNRKSGVRLHPLSDVERLIEIQDIINLTKSLILDNARQRNYVRFMIAKSLQKYEKKFSTFLEGAGLFFVDDEILKDKLYEKVDTPELPKEIYEFLDIAQEIIKDNGIVHESLSGSLPENKQNLSGIAIQRLQNANKQKLQYKETNINWAISQGGRRIYRIYAEEYTSAEFQAIIGGKKNDPSHTVLNGTMTLAEYTQFLQQIYPNVDPIVAGKLFEKNNDVEIQYAKTGEEGGEQDPAEIFAEKSVVYINHLINPNSQKPYKFAIKIGFDYEAERNELENRIVAREMFVDGVLDAEMFLEYSGPPFSDRKEEILEKNKLYQLAKILEQRPDLTAIVQQLMNYPPEKIMEILQAGQLQAV